MRSTAATVFLILCVLGNARCSLLQAESREGAWQSSVKVAIVAANVDDPERSLEFITVWKSMLLHARCKIHATFIVGSEQDKEIIRQLLAPIYSPPQAVGYSFVMFNGSWVLHQVTKTWRLEFRKHAGVPGLAKFFLPDLLHKHSRVLLLDTDLVFGSDVCLLWKTTFGAFKEDTVIMFPQHHPEKVIGTNWEPEPFNSGVGALDLDRMRAIGWTIQGRKEHVPGSKLFRNAVEWFPERRMVSADQSLFNAVWWTMKDTTPYIFLTLPVSWNLMPCIDEFHGVIFGKSLPTEGLGAGAFFGIMHYNCPIPKAWGEVLHHYQVFNPEFLNQGRSKEQIRMKEVKYPKGAFDNWVLDPSCRKQPLLS